MAIHKIKFFAGRGSRYLAEKIVASYGTKLGESEVLNFSDGEFQPCFLESIRGCTVFVIQSTFPPTDNLMELLMMIDAAKRASAHQVIAVMPYFGWARQDRKDRPRVPIGAKLVANLLVAAGVDRIMTMDLHADQIQGFFDVPVDALYASGIFVPYIQSLNIEDLSIAAPDMGGAKRANTYAKLLGTPIIISHKERAKANVVGKMTAIGDVEGRNVLMVGNNTKEDLAACQLGCEGFLVTDFLIDPVGFEVFSVRHGSMEKFADWVDSLPECADPAQGVSDAIVPAAARERVLAACGIADGQAGGAKTLEEAGRSGGTDFVINGMED